MRHALPALDRPFAILAPFALLASPAVAQDAAANVDAEKGAAAMEQMAETLSDPERQQQIVSTLTVLSEAMLDMPLAPLLEPLNRAASEATGEEPRQIDPDMTLRSAAPNADELPQQIEQRLPEAMNQLAAMSDSFAALLPALVAMGEQLKDRLPIDRLQTN